MFRFLFSFLLLSVLATANQFPLRPGHVAVVYNSAIPKSRELAETYAQLRRIPAGNLIGIDVPKEQDVSREVFERKIRDPLREQFTKRQWWTLAKDQNGTILPTQSTIRSMAIMKGVPLRIRRTPPPASEADNKAQFHQHNEAAVDSELALLGVQGYPIGSAIPNQYFNKTTSFVESPLQFILLVGRIDAKDYDTCTRMILDALETEKEGLWGRTYLDFSLKVGAYKEGDTWLERITKRAQKAGFPVVTERTKDTFTTNYPMTDAALYFGWYTPHRNGPFLNPKMKFRKGAIAVHLHSLSAAQLGNPAVNWSTGLLDRGAAATLGNTWEPYLQMSHNFDIFHDRLLKGYSLVESAYMAIKVLSWQGVVLGDPLYRPFLNFAKPPQDLSTDKAYKAIRLAHLQWSDPVELTPKLRGAAARMNSGIIYEGMGFGLLEAKQYDAASAFFQSARKHYSSKADQLRQILNQVGSKRRQNKPQKALEILRKWRPIYKDIPEVKSIDGLITILDPPPPPPTKPKRR
ncbi:MAG: TIGR03790 family protein [Akkermansiaceae bacterium]